MHSLLNIRKAFKLSRRCINVNTPSAILINAFNIADASPENNLPLIWLHDAHNNIKFIVDTASPQPLVPLSKFPSFAGSSAQYSLFTADGKPLYQASVIDLTWQFNKFPNTYFSQHFILANVQNAILGLDFLCKYHFIVDTFDKSITIQKPFSHDQLPSLQPIDYSSCSYSDIFDLFPDLTSYTIAIPKRHILEHILEVDYRVINSRTKKQNYPLQHIYDLIPHIRATTTFSSRDLKNAFWQLDVRPFDRKYTAFCTSRGTYEYNKLPQGLRHASGTFPKIYQPCHARNKILLFLLR